MKNLFTCFCRLLTLISPKLNNKFLYLVIEHKRLNLRNPKSFPEKLCKLKLEKYIHDPRVKMCADKYRVRQYIESKGLSDILVPLLAAYDTPNQIDWNKLPQSFVIKWNYDAGLNYICRDKTKIDIAQVVEKLIVMGKYMGYLDKAELQYKVAQKKLIIEQFLPSDKNDLPADYKVYCFNGKPTCILYINDRETDDFTAAFYDFDWKFISLPLKARHYKPMTQTPEKPPCLDKMKSISEQLSAEFEFVRIDYYVVGEKLYFGEMTFTPASGLFPSECLINGKTMGEILKI